MGGAGDSFYETIAFWLVAVGEGVALPIIGRLLGHSQPQTTARYAHVDSDPALAAANIPVDEALIYNTDWQSTGGHAATSKFPSMDDGPSAVFYSSYVLAIGALECMRSAGLTPGERLHLVSFDDPDLFSLTTPGITAIAQPTAAIARALAQITLSRLNGERDQAPRTITLDCDLMLRGSLGMNTGTPK